MTNSPLFQGWPKIARLRRDIIITEKIDGTNAAVGILEDGTVYAQSRTRILRPGESDNFGFRAWVEANREELIELLGPGLHFGEWWGKGIQRGYGLSGRRFSLFNARRFQDLPGNRIGVGVVPTLYEGEFHSTAIDTVLDHLELLGSAAAPGFMRPEGIVVYHTAANVGFKVTLENDDIPKGMAA